MYRKLVCQKLTNNFKEAVALKSVPLPQPEPNQIVVKNRYCGINASDINFTSGAYSFGQKIQLPFDVGFEGLGYVHKIGSEVKAWKEGQPVVYRGNSFAEYTVIDATSAIPLPEAKPEYLTLLVSGLTAGLALGELGELKPKETVLVTAAAGGTGQIAVQWAKLQGCRVLGTCSTDEKMDFLKSIGCDRPINYKQEDLAKVLKEECPKGVDVVYECVGGDVFEACVDNLALHGRLIVIGAISSYKESTSDTKANNSLFSTLPFKFLTKSASLRGFLLLHFPQKFPEYFTQLIKYLEAGKLKVNVDLGEQTGKKFSGVDDITRAVEVNPFRKWALMMNDKRPSNEFRLFTVHIRNLKHEVYEFTCPTPCQYRRNECALQNTRVEDGSFTENVTKSMVD